MQRINLFGLTHEELEKEFISQGIERYRSEQVFYWLYNRCVDSFLEMSNIPKKLREQLCSTYAIEHPKIITIQSSTDGTQKILFVLNDKVKIESVLIPSESAEISSPKRITLCLSTQAGCLLNCHFCATAAMKLRRNLTSGEIAGQYFSIQKRIARRITNLVFMGMGEPMLNYDATMKSIEIITHEKTCGVTGGHITVSTVGIPDGIRRMADEKRKVKLAISLHATTDELRSRLMPVNRKHNLSNLFEAAEYYYRKTRRRITYEYILFDGLNDGEDDIRRLVKIARRIPSKINIIPFHPIASTYSKDILPDLKPATNERIEQFVAALRNNNITVMLRSSSGKDIDAACGQLAIKNERSEL